MNFNTLPRQALLRAEQFLLPHGPVPYRKTRWYDAVREGEAPAPAVKRHRMAAWRWGDILDWLEQQAAGNGESA